MVLILIRLIWLLCSYVVCGRLYCIGLLCCWCYCFDCVSGLGVFCFVFDG